MSDPSKPQLATIILAAGASTRMGRPKQLLAYDGKNLLQHIIAVSEQLQNRPIVVVLGAYAEKILPTLTGLPVSIVQNDSWSTGMGSSIKAGTKHLLSMFPNIQAVLILLVDQPFVDLFFLQQLVHLYHTANASIICSAYNDQLGVPAIFDHTLFESLLHLNEAVGARKLIRSYQGKVVSVPFEHGAFDLDTEADWQRFLDGLGSETKKSNKTNPGN